MAVCTKMENCYKNNSLYRSKVGKYFPSDWNDLMLSLMIGKEED